MRRVVVEASYDREKRAYLTREGLFHAWGTEACGNDDAPCVQTVGIVEYEDGSISLVFPERIRFLEPTQ